MDFDDKTGKSGVPVAALVPFFIATFALAWSILALYLAAPQWASATFGAISGQHPLFVLAVYSPAIAGIAIVLYYAGTAGLRRYLTRLLLWRAPAAWWMFLLLGIPVIFFAGSIVKGNAATAALFTESFPAMLAAIAFMMVLGPVEELGWRGVALPLLQRRLAPAWAGMVLGVIWGIWHLPAFFLGGTPQSEWGFTPFLVGAVAISVIVTQLFNRSGGSILLAMVFHFQLINPLWPDAQPYDTVFFVVTAAFVAWLNRATMFTRGAGVTDVSPSPARLHATGRGLPVE